MKITLEKFYTFPIRTFKLKSKYNHLRIEFEHSPRFSAFLNKYYSNDNKTKGLGTCLFLGPIWIVDIDPSIIDLTLETED